MQILIDNFHMYVKFEADNNGWTNYIGTKTTRVMCNKNVHRDYCEEYLREEVTIVLQYFLSTNVALNKLVMDNFISIKTFLK